MRRSTVEEYRSIDICSFSECLKEGWDRVVLNWYGNKIDVFICRDDYDQKIDRLALDMKRSWVSLYLVTTPANYGGVRYWLKCPHCNKKKRFLYQNGPHWFCRNCGDLGYSSSQGTTKFTRQYSQDIREFKEETRLYAEYKRVFSQKRKQTHYRGVLIKALRPRL